MLIHPRWERAVTGGRIDQLDPRRISQLRLALVMKSRQQYSRANPRPPAGMLYLAEELIPREAPAAELDLLVEPSLSDDIPPELLRPFHRVWRSPEPAPEDWPKAHLKELRAQDYDTLILLYPDAIGVGWRRIERRLASLAISRTMALNGRGRIFFLDPKGRRTLAGRRLMEGTRLLETALALAVVVMGPILAAWDGLIDLTRGLRKPPGP